MRIPFSILLFFCLLGCNTSVDTKDTIIKDSLQVVIKKDSGQSNFDSQANTTLENKITDTLMTLPFVKKSNANIESFTNHQHGIAFIFDKPEKNETDISVKAGYNGEARFETYYRFYINPKSLEITVYDIANDLKMPLKDYIKLNL